jgi:hypothetical protein
MECSLAVEPLWGFNYFRFIFIALLMHFLKPIKSGSRRVSAGFKLLNYDDEGERMKLIARSQILTARDGNIYDQRSRRFVSRVWLMSWESFDIAGTTQTKVKSHATM